MTIENWTKCLLGDFVTLQRGFDITKKQQQEGPYPVISSSGIKSWHTEYKQRGPGVIIGRKGTLGTAFYIEDNYWPHDTTLWVKDFHGNHPKYCYYFFKTLGLENYDVGASNPTINRNHIHLVEIICPPLPAQRRIASVLSAYDDLIENNTRRIAILEEMARLIYQEWFVHFRFPGHEKVKMVESELGPIPEGWEEDQLGNVANIVMGQSPKSEFYNEDGEGLPFHQGVSNFGTLFPKDKVFCTVMNRMAEEGDILFSVRAPVGRINVATKKIVVGRGLSAIRSKDGFQPFLLCQLKHLFVEEDIIGGGTIFKAVTKKDMLEMKVSRPETAIIRDFCAKIDPMFKLIRCLSDKNNNLRTQRDLLLPKLISGEIDVSEIPKMESAAA